MRIFNAYPAFHRKGETFCCYPFEGHAIPDWLTFGGWLGGARHWHFAMMWVLVVNGFVYLGLVYLHGEWRDLVPRRGDHPRCLADGAVLSVHPPAASPAGEAQRAAEGRVFRDAVDRRADRAVGASRSGSPSSWRRSPRCSAGTCGRGTGTSWGWSRSSAWRRGTCSWCSRSIPTSLPSMITGRYNERFSPERAMAGRSTISCRGGRRASRCVPGTGGGRYVAPSRRACSRRASSRRSAASTAGASCWRVAGRSVRPCWRPAGAAGRRARSASCNYAERKNETVERALFRHTSMDEAGTHALDAGKAFPAYFIAPTVPVLGCQGQRAVDAGGERHGGETDATLARRSPADAVGDAAHQPLLRRRVAGDRVVDRRPPARPGRRRWAPIRRRGTSTSNRSTTATTRAGTSRARRTRRR